MTVECTTEASPKAITYWVFKVMICDDDDDDGDDGDDVGDDH